MNLSISLPDSDADFVRKSVESGRFDSSSEVVRAALQLMQQAERADADKLVRLREAWEAGVASGDGGEVDFATLKSEARAR
jgi:antitoxin ParD1/3/4